MSYITKLRIYVYCFHCINYDYILLGGLAEEVDEKVLNAAFIPFGDIVDIQIPLDYETEKHRGFAFVEFEAAEDAAASIDNMVKNFII